MAATKTPPTGADAARGSIREIARKHGLDFVLSAIGLPSWTADIATKQEIEAADDQYGTDEVQIDPDARVSRDEDGGAWVQAWLWLPPKDDEGADLEGDAYRETKHFR